MLFREKIEILSNCAILKESKNLQEGYTSRLLMEKQQSQTSYGPLCTSSVPSHPGIAYNWVTTKVLFKKNLVNSTSNCESSCQSIEV